MRIGELAARTGVPTRLLRYYEEQGLLSPARAPNGYRDYDDGLTGRVTQIRGLLDAGVPTRIIREILPCLDDPASIHVTEATPELIADLEHHHAQMDAKIQCLARNRDAIGTYLSALAEAQRGSGVGPPNATSGERDGNQPHQAHPTRVIRRNATNTFNPGEAG